MEISELKNKVNLLLIRHPEIERVILFGSFARGTQTRRSDIDLIIIMDTKLPFLQRYEGIHKELLDALKPYPLEFFIYTPDEFKRMQEGGNRFLSRVLKEGIILYEKEVPNHKHQIPNKFQ